MLCGPGASEMPNKQKRRKRKNGIPARWLDYCPIGQRIPGTRFIAFKVPLKPSPNCRVPEAHSFGLWDLLDSVESQNQELGLIIDLTFTTKYYMLTDVPQSCSYFKIFIQGHHIPSDAAILSFKRVVRRFLRENQDNDKLIGVHCTHGLNRTGYLVCRYLIDVDGLDPPEALELFNSCRGHCIERENYVEDSSCVMISVYGAAAFCYKSPTTQLLSPRDGHHLVFPFQLHLFTLKL